MGEIIKTEFPQNFGIERDLKLKLEEIIYSEEFVGKLCVASAVGVLQMISSDLLESARY